MEQPIEQPCYTAEDYWALPDDVRAELIDGQFYDMATPSRVHQAILMHLCVTIYNHIREKDSDCQVYPAPFGVQLSANKDNIVEPDISVICDPKKLTDRGCVGAPDWIIEIASPSNEGHDYIRKLHLYSETGVREYWIVNPMEKNVIVYTDLDQEKPHVATHGFQGYVSVGICEDFQIDLGEIDRLLR